jgi:hypothetical protein
MPVHFGIDFIANKRAVLAPEKLPDAVDHVHHHG